MKIGAPKQRYVSVAFRDLEKIRKPIGAQNTYTYAWRFPEEPTPGTWVEVKGSDKLATAVIVDVDVTPDRGYEIKPVVRFLSQGELDAAWKDATDRELMIEAGMPIWLDMMRKKAGLKVERELPSTVPTGWPEIPPMKGTVIGQPAYDRGRVWMRAHHRAKEIGRMEDAVVFEQIARDWYARGRKRKKD